MSLSFFSSVTTSQVHLEIFSIVRGQFFFSLLLFLTTLRKQKSWLARSKRFAYISHSAILVERHFLERYWFSHTSPGYIRVSPVGSQAAQWEMEEEEEDLWETAHNEHFVSYKVLLAWICPRYHGQFHSQHFLSSSQGSDLPFRWTELWWQALKQNESHDLRRVWKLDLKWSACSKCVWVD